MCKSTVDTSTLKCQCDKEKPPVDSLVMVPVGTVIRFTQTIEDGPNDHTPGYIWAKKGQIGRIVGPPILGLGYKVSLYGSPFRAKQEEFEVVAP